MSTKDAKILIVEDEEHINRLIEMVLVSDGYYKIQKAFDGLQALEIINKDKPNLILLDVMIPEIDGFELCKIIKNDDRFNTVSIIMLTAKNTDDDILNGFYNGAVDYIPKPFNNKILLARINSHLQNTCTKNAIKKYKGISLDTDKKIVKVDDEIIDLTNFEFKILENFISNIGVVFSRSALLSYLRGNDAYEISERAVDVQIVNLRRKLGIYGADIETIRSVGYKLRDL